MALKKFSNQMSVSRFFVYYQGKEDFFLRITARVSKQSNLYQLFGSFLNEFAKTFNLGNKSPSNALFYLIDASSGDRKLIPDSSYDIPEKGYEYLIMEKEYANDNKPATTSDPEVSDLLIQKGQEFQSKGMYYSAYSFYSAAGKKSISNLIKMYYELNDYPSIIKYLNEISIQDDLDIKDPYMNEIIGYAYEWQNNKSKAIETFQICKDICPIQTVALQRFLLSVNQRKSQNKNRYKSDIERDYLLCMKPEEPPFDFRSLLDNSAFKMPPRSEKVYTHEVVKTFIKCSMDREAIEYTVKNTKFFRHNLPLILKNQSTASAFVSAVLNKHLAVSVARQICFDLLIENQQDTALRIAMYLYESDKLNLQYVSLLMTVYYFMLKIEKIAEVSAELIQNYESVSRPYDPKAPFESFSHAYDPKASFESISHVYDMKMDRIISEMKKIPDFNLQTPNAKPNPKYEKNPVFDQISTQDKYDFIVFIILYLFINHKTRDVKNMQIEYQKLIQYSVLSRDEINRIFHIIKDFDVLNFNFSPQNKKFCVVGDFTVFLHSNIIFKITDKAVHSDGRRDIEDFQKYNGYQSLANKDEKGILIQSQGFPIPEFSLWRLREDKKNKKYVKAAFNSRLLEIKELLTKTKSLDDPILFAFGRRDVLNHIPRLITKRKFATIDDLKKYYSALFVNVIKKIREFLPKVEIFALIDDSEKKYVCFASILYEAICLNVPRNVEIVPPLFKYEDKFSRVFDPTYFIKDIDDRQRDIDDRYFYYYKFFLDKKRKLLHK